LDDDVSDIEPGIAVKRKTYALPAFAFLFVKSTKTSGKLAMGLEDQFPYPLNIRR
jgi:hypothetical protein